MLSMLALAVAAFQIAPVPTCDALRLETGACAQAPYGVIVGDDQAMADRFAEVMRQGEDRFRAHFGREPTPYAVLVGNVVNPISEGGVSGGGSAELQARLTDTGAQHILPWFTTEQRNRLTAATTRRGIEARARGEGLEGEALAAAVEQRLASARPPAASADQDSAAAHELGHMWTVAAFWPDRARGRSVGHYGGPAADWFDETSAVLMEDEPMTAGRRESFRTQWTKAGGARPKSLATYFVDPHPLADVRTRIPAGAMPAGSLPPGITPGGPMPADARPVSELPGGELRMADGRVIRAEDLPPGAVFVMRQGPGAAPPPGAVPQGSQPSVRSLSVASSQAFRSDAERDAAVMFYAQARVFADFLFERTGDPTVYGRIAAAMAGGQTMEQWIAAEGPALNLGATVAEVETQWQAWLTRTYGASA